MSGNRQIEELREEIALLRERLALMNEALSGRCMYLPGVRLSPTERTILNLLAIRPIVGRGQAIDVIYGCRAEPAGEKIMDVFIHRMRKKLKPYGIEIETVWGHGYRLPPESKAALQKLREAA